jgi:hypothetical protein
MIVALLLVLSLCTPGLKTRPPTAGQPDPKIIRVHVQTDDDGDAAELGARRESVRHLQAAIGEKKKANIVSTSTMEDADVILEVEGRSVTVPKVIIGLGGGMGSPNGRPPGAPTGPVKAIKLKVTMALARDGDPIELANKNRANESESGWKSAAEDVAKQVEKWISEHRAAIIAARGR